MNARPEARRWPRVVTVVGTRPEIIKLSRIVAELDAHTDHRLVHTGQNYDPMLSRAFFDELGMRPPDVHLDAARAGAADTIAEVIARSDRLFEDLKPDAIVVYGDTNSGLAVIPAKRRRIPIFHLEAGNRCFDFRVPEEINRRIIDHLSDINLTHSDHARRYLLAEGLPPERIIKIGSPMKEILDSHRDRIEDSTVLARLYLDPGEYFLLSAHREENVDDPVRLTGLLACIDAVTKRFGRRVIVSTHPRTAKRLEALNRPLPGDLMPPFGFFDYVKLQRHAACVISDSGTLTEEASILNLPAVMIRDAHERPEGMDEATAILSPLSPDRLLTAVEAAIDHASAAGRPAAPVSDYQVEQVSRKVVRLILSHIDYVDRVVWHKQTVA